MSTLDRRAPAPQSGEPGPVPTRPESRSLLGLVLGFSVGLLDPIEVRVNTSNVDVTGSVGACAPTDKRRGRKRPTCSPRSSLRPRA